MSPSIANKRARELIEEDLGDDSESKQDDSENELIVAEREGSDEHHSNSPGVSEMSSSPEQPEQPSSTWMTT